MFMLFIVFLFDTNICSNDLAFKSLLTFTSRCPLKAQISQGLGPPFWIELLTTGRNFSVAPV